MRAVYTIALLLAASPAIAQEAEGLPVTVVVVDPVGEPIPNAWVRIPDTEGRRRVDPSNGRWTASSVYGFDGSEIIFKKSMILDLTISAPGYQARTVQYRVAKRRNVVTVSLPPLEEIDLGEESDEELVIRWFQRTDFEESDD